MLAKPFASVEAKSISLVSGSFFGHGYGELRPGGVHGGHRGSPPVNEQGLVDRCHVGGQRLATATAAARESGRSQFAFAEKLQTIYSSKMPEIQTLVCLDFRHLKSV